MYNGRSFANRFSNVLQYFFSPPRQLDLGDLKNNKMKKMSFPFCCGDSELFSQKLVFHWGRKVRLKQFFPNCGLKSSDKWHENQVDT